MIFKPFDVVTMPFPFADRSQSIVRPTVILTEFAGFGDRSGIVLIAMITSAKRSSWPFDVPISDLKSAGLPMPSLVRMKLNAVDYSLMEKKIGEISPVDRLAISASLQHVFAGVI